MSDGTPAPKLRYDPTTKTVQDLVNYFENGQLKLDPPFQRNSVWAVRDRAKLIDSLVNGFPIPSIYLHERTEDRRIVYDVIDGKQRLESILMFMGRLRGRGRFEADVLWPGGEERETVSWASLGRRDLGQVLLRYRIPVHVVSGDLAEVIELFVRINSTGKALTAAERRHARYNRSPFLKAAEGIATRLEATFRQHRVMSDGQIGRMKHVELVCELMLAAHRGDVQHKKAALDAVMQSSGGFTDRQVRLAKDRTRGALNRVFRLFPDIRETRFRQVSDFYSLAVVIERFESEGLILNDRRRNRLAASLLAAFGRGVDGLKDKARRFQGATPDEDVYRQYAQTVAEGTDSHAQRRTREKLLRALLEPLFQTKDERRGFTSEQRRILWHSAEERRCIECKRKLTWDDFTIDHVDPYSRGGRTNLENAALMCREHNSAKGSRPRRTRRAA